MIGSKLSCSTFILKLVVALVAFPLWSDTDIWIVHSFDSNGASPDTIAVAVVPFDASDKLLESPTTVQACSKGPPVVLRFLDREASSLKLELSL